MHSRMSRICSHSFVVYYPCLHKGLTIITGSQFLCHRHLYCPFHLLSCMMSSTATSNKSFILLLGWRFALTYILLYLLHLILTTYQTMYIILSSLCSWPQAIIYIPCIPNLNQFLNAGEQHSISPGTKDIRRTDM